MNDSTSAGSYSLPSSWRAPSTAANSSRGRFGLLMSWFYPLWRARSSALVCDEDAFRGPGLRDYAERSVLPIRGKGVVEKTTSTGTSKYSAIRNAR